MSTNTAISQEHVFIVGSWTSGDKCNFLADRVYGEHKEKEAIAYCDSRANKKFDWEVKKAPLGEYDFTDWETIHYVERTK